MRSHKPMQKYAAYMRIFADRHNFHVILKMLFMRKICDMRVLENYAIAYVMHICI